MSRPQALALALILTLAGPISTAHAQSTISNLLDANSKRASAPQSHYKTSIDLGDWLAYNRAGWRAINKGYYDTAEHEFLAAIKAARRPSLDDARLLARSYADYAWAIQKQGRHAEAEPLARWSLTAREALMEPDAPAVAQTRNQLATLYYELGRFAEAESLLHRAIEGQAKSRKVNALEHARSQTLMGLLLVAQRRYVEAEPFFAKAVNLRDKAQGPAHPETRRQPE